MTKTPTLLPSSNPRVPIAVKPFRHCFDVQTRFTDIDIFGHINNNVYFSMMDLAKIHYFKAITNGRGGLADIRAVVVHVDCDFFEPSLFDEPLQVWTTITHVGTRSFTIQQRIVNTDTLSTKCIGTTILAGFDPDTQSGAPLDEAMIVAAQAYEQREL